MTHLFIAHQPVAARASGANGSCGPPGTVHSFDQLPTYAAEFQRLCTGTLDPDLPLAECLALVPVVRSLMLKARRGRLRFLGDDPEGRTLASSSFVYEMRPHQLTSFGRARVLRAYCAEPAQPAKGILGLQLATKPGDGPDHAHEQNQAIAQAEQRAHQWSAGHYLRVS